MTASKVRVERKWTRTFRAVRFAAVDSIIIDGWIQCFARGRDARG